MGQVCRRSTGPAVPVVGATSAAEQGHPGGTQVLILGLFGTLFFAVRCVHGAMVNGTAFFSGVGCGAAPHPGGLLGRGALVLSSLLAPLRQPDEEPEEAVAVAAH